MNLEEALQDVERGLTGEEHAAVIRDALDWNKNLTGKALDRVAKMDELLAESRAERDELTLELNAWKARRCETCRCKGESVRDNKCLYRCSWWGIDVGEKQYCSEWEAIDGR